ncbi:multicopper oxidase domain-containing protein [Dehalogenimonas sp. 4OHTPN]|uniref:Multicopper oxidase domain-containing protein n=1 Tax=Dehalogenimonas sp. 4OHTPN TaxID=3166643 RepID=A0AAU8GB68_9CHLR
MENQKTGISRREFMRRAGLTAAGAGGVLLAESALIRGMTLFAAPKPPPAGQVPLPGNKIPQFIDPLPVLDLNPQSTTGIPTVVAGANELVLNMHTFKANIMPSTWAAANPGYTGTWTFGYRVNEATAPGTVETNVGPVIVASRGTPTQIRYVNNLEASANTIHWRDWTDQTLHSAFHQAKDAMMPIPADAQAHYDGPVLAVPHLHGGEVPAVVDGGPEAWFASDVPGNAAITKDKGPAYYSKAGAAANECIYTYPNSQEAAPLWFHDHLLGGTRLNATFGGLAGAYALIDPNLTLPAGLHPVGLKRGETIDYLIPLVIQDRMFDTNGQLLMPNVGVNPEHPYWVPEFVGDTIIVNGKVWPYLAVEQKRYRFFLINGSNSRAYDMFLQDTTSGIKGPRMWVIATDGGYLDAPVLIDPNANGQQIKAGQQTSLMMMPGERYEIIVDFADPVWRGLLAARGIRFPLNLTLRNTAPTVNGNPKASTEGRIMQFRVSTVAPATDTSYDPASGIALRPPMVRLAGVAQAKTRFLTLNEIVGAGGPLEALVNNTKWSGLRHGMGGGPPEPIPGSTFVAPNWLTELPNEGDTEIWEIANMTMDSHPIHLHAVQFQLLSRQPFDMKAFMAAYDMAFPGGMFMPGHGPPLPYSPDLDGYDAVLQGNKWGGNPDYTNFLLGQPTPPLAYEAGWKDTVIMRMGEITRIAVRWAPQDVPAGTSGSFPFDPAAGNGVYVWHCHITDHEDNEMMRPDQIQPKTGATRDFEIGTDF